MGWVAPSFFGLCDLVTLYEHIKMGKMQKANELIFFLLSKRLK